MYWRIGSDYRKQDSGANKAMFRTIVKRGPPPGLLAFDGDVAVGWCQLTPRDALPWLNRAWRLRRVDDEPVWSISCLYVAQGLSAARRHDGADRRSRESGKARQRTRHRSLPARRDEVAQRDRNRLRLDVRARRVHDDRAAHTAAAHHAAALVVIVVIRDW
jgi:hypothetical protein